MINLYSLQVENALLGLVLKNEKLIHKILGHVKIQDFYFQENKYVYTSLEKCFQHKKTTEPQIVIDYLVEFSEKTREEWINYLADLIFQAGLEGNMDNYIDTLKEYEIRESPNL